MEKKVIEELIKINNITDAKITGENREELQRHLKYIDSELLVKSYLCGFDESIADIVLFITLSPIVSKWDYYTKEQYINISRWFTTLQTSKMLKGKCDTITLPKTLLYNELKQKITLN